MQLEKLTLKSKNISAKVSNTQVNAIRKKDIQKNAIRVHANGYIGVSGAYGPLNESLLTSQAQANLASKIEYGYPLEEELEVNTNKKIKEFSEQEVLEEAQTLLKHLKKEFSSLSFSESVTYNELFISYENSLGRRLQHCDAHFSAELIIKEKTSANLFDGVFYYLSRELEQDKMLLSAFEQLTAYSHKVALPHQKKLPVFFMGTETFQPFFARNLHGERYALNTSLFSGKKGEILFHEKLTLAHRSKEVCRDITPNFDREGVLVPQEGIPLIQNGVLTKLLADKRTAQKYKLNGTAAAGGSYNEVPSLLAWAPLTPFIDSENLTSIIGSEPAILVNIAAGGDFTSEGHFATPVQNAFLFDGKKLIGRLPAFSVFGNMFDLFGKDYIGTFKSPFTELSFEEGGRPLVGLMMSLS